MNGLMSRREAIRRIFCLASSVVLPIDALSSNNYELKKPNGSALSNLIDDVFRHPDLSINDTFSVFYKSRNPNKGINSFEVVIPYKGLATELYGENLVMGVSVLGKGKSKIEALETTIIIAEPMYLKQGSSGLSFISDDFRKLGDRKEGFSFLGYNETPETAFWLNSSNNLFTHTHYHSENPHYPFDNRNKEKVIKNHIEKGNVSFNEASKAYDVFISEYHNKAIKANDSAKIRLKEALEHIK